MVMRVRMVTRVCWYPALGLCLITSCKLCFQSSSQTVLPALL